MIVVFGSVALDLVTNVARIPNPGESLQCPTYALVPSSKGGNQAVAAARSDAHVVHIASVGRDAYADLATATLRAEGVDFGAGDTLMLQMEVAPHDNDVDKLRPMLPPYNVGSIGLTFFSNFCL